jgi:hypothetical protein
VHLVGFVIMKGTNCLMDSVNICEHTDAITSRPALSMLQAITTQRAWLSIFVCACERFCISVSILFFNFIYCMYLLYVFHLCGLGT